MSLIAIVLVFIMAIVVTVFLSHLLPVKVPLPLIQIAAGAALAASGFQVDFDPHIFLLLFIPPLLFLDGWRIPKDAFFRDMKPILSLAIGLVMVTILGIGLFIHWLIPAITVAAGFAPRGYSVAYRSGGGIGNDRQLAASLKDGAYSRRGVAVKRCFRARRL
ncbi:Na+/H+ antiporter [Klebsiella pneumoniae]|nr:Na+/H+ antiporter [Klebsiella pneumoniae]